MILCQLANSLRRGRVKEARGWKPTREDILICATLRRSKACGGEDGIPAENLPLKNTPKGPTFA